MAIIYTKCGQYENAMNELEVLLSEQTSYSVNALEMSNHFEPLRKLPRYQELIRKYDNTAGS